MKRLYYAHSIALYGTEQEKRDIATLELMGFKVVNPNAPEHDEGYRSKGMAHFSDVLDDCHGLAFRANPDGTINAGVVFEIAYMVTNDKPVIELPSMIERRELTVEQTRQYLREQGAR